ncbi:MAG: hypothetical protein COV52_08095 [Gammaproteobacteria bacterium CG11_big_fil_rev_8_21_14_0_20_46_22]|nr:MAG: hypothetical protein COW05_00035 [Gammaproteobacteria bacterium CG12_big_fil_rev_8_21_14_0_65_46_12]PIR10624.1 MAG: hypothetical protein COV52_08095 [Gammaproteobacteria bacterium CG11_big_fil_rev_8_21_14_0_20_46_22]
MHQVNNKNAAFSQALPLPEAFEKIKLDNNWPNTPSFNDEDFPHFQNLRNIKRLGGPIYEDRLIYLLYPVAQRLMQPEPLLYGETQAIARKVALVSHLLPKKGAGHPFLREEGFSFTDTDLEKLLEEFQPDNGDFKDRVSTQSRALAQFDTKKPSLRERFKQVADQPVGNAGSPNTEAQEEHLQVLVAEIKKLAQDSSNTFRHQAVWSLKSAFSNLPGMGALDPEKSEAIKANVNQHLFKLGYESLSSVFSELAKDKSIPYGDLALAGIGPAAPVSFEGHDERLALRSSEHGNDRKAPGYAVAETYRAWLKSDGFSEQHIDRFLKCLHQNGLLQLGVGEQSPIHNLALLYPLLEGQNSHPKLRFSVKSASVLHVVQTFEIGLPGEQKSRVKVEFDLDFSDEKNVKVANVRPDFSNSATLFELLAMSEHEITGLQGRLPSEQRLKKQSKQSPSFEKHRSTSVVYLDKLAAEYLEQRSLDSVTSDGREDSGPNDGASLSGSSSPPGSSPSVASDSVSSLTRTSSSSSFGAIANQLARNSKKQPQIASENKNPELDIIAYYKNLKRGCMKNGRGEGNRAAIVKHLRDLAERIKPARNNRGEVKLEDAIEAFNQFTNPHRVGKSDPYTGTRTRVARIGRRNRDVLRLLADDDILQLSSHSVLHELFFGDADKNPTKEDTRKGYLSSKRARKLKPRLPLGSEPLSQSGSSEKQNVATEDELLQAFSASYRDGLANDLAFLDPYSDANIAHIAQDFCRDDGSHNPLLDGAKFSVRKGNQESDEAYVERLKSACTTALNRGGISFKEEFAADILLLCTQKYFKSVKQLSEGDPLHYAAQMLEVFTGNTVTLSVTALAPDKVRIVQQFTSSYGDKTLDFKGHLEFDLSFHQNALRRCSIDSLRVVIDDSPASFLHVAQVKTLEQRNQIGDKIQAAIECKASAALDKGPTEGEAAVGAQRQRPTALGSPARGAALAKDDGGDGKKTPTPTPGAKI